MPVQTDNLNDMIEYYNRIRDILDENVLDIQKCRDFLSQINLNRDVNNISNNITCKIIYYLIEIAHDEEEMLLYEKCAHLANTLEEMVEILRGEHPNRKAALLRTWIKCATNRDTHSPFFNNLKYLTKDIIKETKRLIFDEAPKEQVVPDLTQDPDFKDEEEDTWQCLV